MYFCPVIRLFFVVCIHQTSDHTDLHPYILHKPAFGFCIYPPFPAAAYARDNSHQVVVWVDPRYAPSPRACSPMTCAHSRVQSSRACTCLQATKGVWDLNTRVLLITVSNYIFAHCRFDALICSLQTIIQKVRTINCKLFFLNNVQL